MLFRSLNVIHKNHKYKLITTMSFNTTLLTDVSCLKTADPKTANIKKCMLMFYDSEDYYVYLYSMTL